MKKICYALYFFGIGFNLACAIYNFFCAKDYEIGCWQVFAAFMFGSCLLNYYWMCKHEERARFYSGLYDEKTEMYSTLSDEFMSLAKERDAVVSELEELRCNTPSRGSNGRFCKRVK